MKKKILIGLLTIIIILSGVSLTAFAEEQVNSSSQDSQSQQQDKSKDNSSQRDADGTDKILLVGAILVVGAIWVTIRKHNDK